MAKPGSDSAREIAQLAQMEKLAADLSDGKLPAVMSAEMQVRAERQLGSRCQGCGRRVTIGIKFTLVEPRVVEGRPTVDVSQVTACNGEGGCDFADEVRKAEPGPTWMEMVEFAWLGPDPADALPEGHEFDARRMPEDEAYDESSPEAAGQTAPAPSRVPAPPSGLAPEAASASGEDPPAVELPPGVDRPDTG